MRTIVDKGLLKLEMKLGLILRRNLLIKLISNSGKRSGTLCKLATITEIEYWCTLILRFL